MKSKFETEVEEESILLKTIKLSKNINERLMTYKRILHRIKMDQIEHTKTSPVVKWAQSIQKIFINFKLSHRHDSPPCSEISFEEFNVRNIPET